MGGRGDGSGKGARKHRGNGRGRGAGRGGERRVDWDAPANGEKSLNKEDHGRKLVNYSQTPSEMDIDPHADGSALKNAESAAGSSGVDKTAARGIVTDSSVTGNPNASVARTPTVAMANMSVAKGGKPADSTPVENMSEQQLEELAQRQREKAEKAAKHAAEKQRRMEEKLELSYVLAPDDESFSNLLKTWDRKDTESRHEFMNYVLVVDWGQSVRDFIVTECRILSADSKKSERPRSKFVRKVNTVLRTAEKAKKDKLQKIQDNLDAAQRPKEDRPSRQTSRQDLAEAKKRSRSEVSSNQSKPRPPPKKHTGEEVAVAEKPADAEMQEPGPVPPSFSKASQDPTKGKWALHVMRQHDEKDGKSKLTEVPHDDWSKTLSQKFNDEVDKAEDLAMEVEAKSAEGGAVPFWPRFELTEYRDGKVFVVATDEETFNWAKAVFKQLRVASHKFIAVPVQDMPQTVLLSIVVPKEVLSDDMATLWRRVCARNKVEVTDLMYVRLGDFPQDKRKRKVLIMATLRAVTKLREADGTCGRRACHLAVRSTQVEIWYKHKPLCKFSDEEMDFEHHT